MTPTCIALNTNATLKLCTLTSLIVEYVNIVKYIDLKNKPNREYFWGAETFGTKFSIESIICTFLDNIKSYL